MVQSYPVMEGCAMGQILHGCATTTEAVRRAIQNSQESLRVPARRYGIDPKTVAKWKKRGSVRDLPTGPKEPRSTFLSLEEEAIIVAFRVGAQAKDLDFQQSGARIRAGTLDCVFCAG